MIGERFKELAAGTALRLDIETSRRAGSTATRGIASGPLAGDARRRVGRLVHRSRGRVPRRVPAASRTNGREPTLEELQAGALGRWDGNIPYRTLGPRHLEAAAFRVCQVLYEGEYSGAMQPEVHYIPLPTTSRTSTTSWPVRDPEQRRRVTSRAYEDLIASGRYSYAAFVAQVDQELLDAGLTPDVAPAERAAIDAALRKGAARRRAVRFHERSVDLARYLAFRVVAPISLRIRRALGLPDPVGLSAPSRR